MREALTETLAAIEERINAMLAKAVLALSGVADALRDPTPERAQAVAAASRWLKLESHEADQQLVTLTALQTPVAGDLRLVVSLIEAAHHIGLIASQFELIGDQLGEISASVIGLEQTTSELAEMAALTVAQLERTALAFRARDPESARRVDAGDDAIDKLNRAIFDQVVALHARHDARELGMRHVLIARSLERIGDNAVDIAEEVGFLLSAEPHEFSDASHPSREPDETRSHA